MKQGIADVDIEKAKGHFNELKQWLLENGTNKNELEALFKQICDSIEKTGQNVNLL